MPDLDDILWRKGGTWKRTWTGPGRQELWALYGGREAQGVQECPDCGRPHLERTAFTKAGHCFNCYQENREPGFHQRAHDILFPQKATGPDGPNQQPQFKKIGG